MTEALVPPQDLSAEESVLGALMLSETALATISENLEPHDFYLQKNAVVYRAALDLYQHGQAVDAITLTDHLDETGHLEDAGGRTRIHELAVLVPATANAPHYARIVSEMATLRGLIRAGGEISRLGWERPGDVENLVDRAEQTVFDLAQHRQQGGLEHLGPSLGETFRQIKEMHEAGTHIVGAPSGFPSLDRKTGGFRDGNLVILAARPSMGKSALALGIGAHLAIQEGKPVALFSLEMSKAEITQRLIALRGNVDLESITRARLTADDWPRVTHACNQIVTAPLYVDESGSLTVMELRARARRMKAREPDLALVIVDYLQLMTAEAENRTQEVTKISRALKVLAKDLQVPVLALSQLSRAVELGGDKRPLLGHLRESGSIEQDADLVLFVYRDEYYHPDGDKKGIAEIILAKHRNGPTGTVELAWRATRAKFGEMA